MDVFVAVVLLLLATPFMTLAIVGIKLSSNGPVLFRAARMGRFEQPFQMFKFRTMTIREENGPEITAPNDNRVFPFGKLLRNSKIDELPQLWNVLTGDMTLVGPRPESVSIVNDHYQDWMRETLTVRPGITSPGAIFGYTHAHALLDDHDPDQSYLDHVLAPKLAIELAYLAKANLFTDIGVIVRTACTVIMIILGRRHFALPSEARAAGKWHEFSESKLDRT